MPLFTIPDYDDWPFKIVYASDGVAWTTLMHTLEDYYESNPQIPAANRPNLIHVAGKYNVIRVGVGGGTTRDGTAIPEGAFYPQLDQSDAFALAYAVQNIQKHALAAKHVLFLYDAMLDSIDF